MAAHPCEWPVPAAIVRLAALTPLDQTAHDALDQAVRLPRQYRGRRDIVAEGSPITDARLILSGWAARARVLADGRRQIISLLLPGDLIGLCDHDRPAATSTIVALTDVDLCLAPSARLSPALGVAYALSRAYDEAYLLAQITRLGRLNAQEKIADLLLELSERLERAGLAAGGRYPLPLTQEMIADVLGLTSVHVNRMLQALRREGAIDWAGRELVIVDPPALASSIGRSAVRVMIEQRVMQ